MDEVTHVTAGHRWFSWICKKKELIHPDNSGRRCGWMRGGIRALSMIRTGPQLVNERFILI